MKFVSISNIGKNQDIFLNSLKEGEELWLTEKKLKFILQKLFPNNIIYSNKTLPILDHKFRPDYFLPELNLVIEFQGLYHFKDIKTINKDLLKISLYNELDIKLIEIPFFVQLTKNVTFYLFNYFIQNKTLIQDFSEGFPHGFLHPKAALLGDFNFCGLRRTYDFLNSFPNEVKEQCFASLERRASLFNIPVNIFNPLLSNLIILFKK